jgi:hypothetical protein
MRATFRTASLLRRPIRPRSLAPLVSRQRRPICNKSSSDSPLPLNCCCYDWTPITQEEINEETEKARLYLASVPCNMYPIDDYEDIYDSICNSTVRKNSPWGFTVVRTVYGAASDAPWARILELLHSNVQHCLGLGLQNHFIPSHALTVIENEEELSGAGSQKVRHAFRAWAAGDLATQFRDKEPDMFGDTAQIRARNMVHHEGADGLPIGAGLPPRWTYCLFVDEDCLRSLDAYTEMIGQEPVVKILHTDWQPGDWADGAQDGENEVAGPWTEDWDGGETDEGLEDVGWMYMDTSDYVGNYSKLTDCHWWKLLYERPTKSYVPTRNLVQ